jgi:hypothetical protein
MNTRKNKMDKIARKVGRVKVREYSDYEPREISVDEKVEMQDNNMEHFHASQQTRQNDDTEMEVQTEKVEPVIDSPIPPMTESGFASLPSYYEDTVEHIIEIDNNTFQIRINLPRRADIKIFKEKVGKLFKLLNSEELVRIFKEEKNNTKNWFGK